MQEKILRDIRFTASVHGAELKGEPQKTSTNPKQSVDPVVPLFGDPEDYSHLSEEVRQQKTDEMLSKHRKWSTDPLGTHTKTQGL